MENWKNKAACKESKSEFFYCDSPDRSVNLKRESIAKSICRKCPVAAECLFDAISRKEIYGIWGSFGPRERSVIVNLFEEDFINVKNCKELVNKDIKSIKLKMYTKGLKI